MRARYPIPIALRLQALHRELNAQMKIRITEPTFFLGQNRKVDEVLTDVEVGPVRTEVIPGGLKRIPQFVEMPEEIKDITKVAAADVGNVASILPVPQPSPVEEPAKTATPASGSFAEATASVLKSPAAPPAPVNKTAAMLSALASRRRNLEKSIVDQANSYGEKLKALETKAPDVFKKADASLEDRDASLGELSDSLRDFAGANDPLSE